MRVSDQGSPPQFADAVVRVTIERDRQKPSFTNQYSANVQENIEVNRVLDVKPSRVEARDQDLKVRYL